MPTPEQQAALDATNLRPIDIRRAEKKLDDWSHRGVFTLQERAEMRAWLDEMRPLVRQREKVIRELRHQYHKGAV